MLSDDDLNLRQMSDEELDAAWDLWFDLAQETNAFDPAYSHGVLVGWVPLCPGRPVLRASGPGPSDDAERSLSGGAATVAEASHRHSEP